MAGMSMAGFLRNEGRVPPSNSEWMDTVVTPQLQDWSGGHGRVLDPSMLGPQAPQSQRMQFAPQWSETGFADFLRNTYLPQPGR